MRGRLWCRLGALTLGAVVVLSGEARAQDCPNIEDNQELRKIPVLVPAPGKSEINTTFDVQLKDFCLPTKTVVKKETRNGIEYTTYTAQKTQLRTYVYPDPDTGRPAWGLPGPTLRVRKAGADGKGGQGIAILLKNSLSASNEMCESACPANIQCAADQCQPDKLNALANACASSSKPNNCCCVINCTQKAPNCFHGDNTTNLHFHGSHVSPQEPQDFVLLELRPGTGPVGDGEDHSSMHNPYSKVAYGKYQYRVDPFRHTQPAGTHWYHPHKHGSVSQQVANGMAGAMIIEGPFDDWLREKQIYDPVNGEKLMVVQQIGQGTKLFQQNQPNQILVNGQLSPRITVKPGEIQRWRIVNATMSSQAMLNIKLDPRLVLKQTAMDGITFSPTNYRCQPLANFNPSNPPATFPCDFRTQITQITLAPGNRVDFLVMMPLQETTEEQPPLRIEREMIDIVDEEDSRRMLLREQDEQIAPGIPEPSLFEVVVDDGIEGNDAELKVLPPTAPKIPDEIPALSDTVASLRAAEAADTDPVTMTFEQVNAVTGAPWPYTGSPLSKFQISGRQYAGSCANVTTRVDTARVWTVSNATRLPHPFHIHTNPFALLDYAGAKLVPGGRPEPIWMDTMPLPVATLTPCANPDQCPGAIPCSIGKPEVCTLNKVSMTFVQRYEEFTGPYVLHCHFLGHEDRGMMYNVQTVCRDKPGFFGKAGVPTPECQGELLKAVDPCK